VGVGAGWWWQLEWFASEDEVRGGCAGKREGAGEWAWASGCVDKPQGRQAVASLQWGKQRLRASTASWDGDGRRRGNDGHAAGSTHPPQPTEASSGQRKPASGRQERHDVRSVGGVAWCDGRSSGAAVGGEPRTGKAAISPCLRLAPSRCRRHQGSESPRQRRAIRLVGSASSALCPLPAVAV
jgi:hypothetical protein